MAGLLPSGGGHADAGGGAGGAVAARIRGAALRAAAAPRVAQGAAGRDALQDGRGARLGKRTPARG
eukprot:100329-Chlamydomonas_euryale.AAC.2